MADTTTTTSTATGSAGSAGAEAAGKPSINLPGGNYTVQTTTPSIQKTAKGAELLGRLNLVLKEKVLKEMGVEVSDSAAMPEEPELVSLLSPAEISHVVTEIVKLKNDVLDADLTQSEKQYLSDCAQSIIDALSMTDTGEQLKALIQVDAKLNAASEVKLHKEQVLGKMKALIASAKVAYTDYTVKLETAKQDPSKTYPVSMTGDASIILGQINVAIELLQKDSPDRKELEAHAKEIDKILQAPTVQKFEKMANKLQPGESVKFDRFAVLKYRFNELLQKLRNILHLSSSQGKANQPPLHIVQRMSLGNSSQPAAPAAPAVAEAVQAPAAGKAKSIEGFMFEAEKKMDEELDALLAKADNANASSEDMMAVARFYEQVGNDFAAMDWFGQAALKGHVPAMKVLVEQSKSGNLNQKEQATKVLEELEGMLQADIKSEKLEAEKVKASESLIKLATLKQDLKTLEAFATTGITAKVKEIATKAYERVGVSLTVQAAVTKPLKVEDLGQSAESPKAGIEKTSLEGLFVQGESLRENGQALEAIQWFEKAAKQGHEFAKKQLGSLIGPDSIGQAANKALVRVNEFLGYMRPAQLCDKGDGYRGVGNMEDAIPFYERAAALGDYLSLGWLQAIAGTDKSRRVESILSIYERHQVSAEKREEFKLLAQEALARVSSAQQAVALAPAAQPPAPSPTVAPAPILAPAPTTVAKPVAVEPAPVPAPTVAPASVARPAAARPAPAPVSLSDEVSELIRDCKRGNRLGESKGSNFYANDVFRAAEAYSEDESVIHLKNLKTVLSEYVGILRSVQKRYLGADNKELTIKAYGDQIQYIERILAAIEASTSKRKK